MRVRERERNSHSNALSFMKFPLAGMDRGLEPGVFNQVYHCFPHFFF